MEFISTPIPGLVLARPKIFADSRGYFMETYNKAVFDPVIGDVNFVQDNESESCGGVLRGLHLQRGDAAQAKLVRVIEGSVFDVSVDLRPGSKTYGKWHGVELSRDNGLMLYIPRGFAHGFLVLSQRARFVYKVDNRYAPESEATIAYNDPDLGIDWPQTPFPLILSAKDSEKAVGFLDFQQL